MSLACGPEYADRSACTEPSTRNSRLSIMDTMSSVPSGSQPSPDGEPLLYYRGTFGGFAA